MVDQTLKNGQNSKIVILWYGRTNPKENKLQLIYKVTREGSQLLNIILALN